MNAKTLPYLFGSIVCLITCCSFVLSFHNLTLVASKAGIPEGYAFLWPICLDAFLMLASLYILRASTLDESPSQGWGVLLVFTGVSTAFNISNSPADWISRGVHAVPPISLCISLEMLMTVLRSDLRRAKNAETLAEMAAETPLSAEEILNEAQLTAETKAEQVRQHFVDNPSDTIRGAAQTLQISRATVWKYKPKDAGDVSS